MGKYRSIIIAGGINGHFKARGTIENKPITFLVDTGASSIVLSNADARRVGIDTDILHYNIPISTANGVTTSARKTIDVLSIGPIIYENISIMISREGKLKNSLIGMSFINQLRSFEIRGDRMILTQ